jgi:prephenate dehydrogenase
VTGGGKLLPVIDGRLPASSPLFHRIAIVGLGAIGGSLGLAVREAWAGSIVIGVDTHAIIETAIRLHVVDVGSDDLMIAAGADLAVLAGGAAENARALPFLAEALAGEAAVLALGSGAAALGLARALPARFPLVAALPAVELPGRGIHAARADLFRGRRWTVTPVTAAGDTVERIYGLIRAIGSEPIAGTDGREGGQPGEAAPA